MYSSRRGSYKYRSRQYYKKKRINRKFSPALYKSPIPDYFQQKGRIIQTSPARIPIVPRYLPNRETLDDMYNALIQANYPGIIPAPSVQYDGWYATSHTLTLSEFFTFSSTSETSNTILDGSWLNTFVNDYVIHPPVPDGYEIYAEVPSIYYDIPSGTSTSLWDLNWINPYFNDTPKLITKNTTVNYSGGYENFVIHISPSDDSHAWIYRVQMSQYSADPNHYFEGRTLIPLSTSVPYLPLLKTDSPSTSYYFQVTRSTTNWTGLIGSITLFILYHFRQTQ